MLRHFKALLVSRSSLQPPQLPLQSFEARRKFHLILIGLKLCQHCMHTKAQGDKSPNENLISPPPNYCSQYLCVANVIALIRFEFAFEEMLVVCGEAFGFNDN